MLGLLAATLIASAQAPPATPGAAAVLPTVLATGEKWEKLRTGLVERVDKGVAKQLLERGFRLLPSDTVLNAIQLAKVDLSDEENYRKELLYSIGDKLKTDFLFFFVITDNRQRNRQNAFVNVPEGEVTVKYWILNVPQRQAIASAKLQTSKARPASWAGFAKGSDQQLTAADRVAVDAMKEFLKPYPVVQKIR